MLFLKKRFKKLVKQNSQVAGFLVPDTAINDESNDTNLSVSFLCVEKLTKQFQKIQNFPSIFSIFKTFQENQYCIFMCKYIQLNVLSELRKIYSCASIFSKTLYPNSENVSSELCCKIGANY